MAGIELIVAGLPKFENISVNQGFFINLGLPPDLLIPIAYLEVIGHSYRCLVIPELYWRAVTQTIYDDNSLLLTAISISHIMTESGRISIEWDVLKREIFPRGKALIQKQLE
ncbi:MAG TPA: hypothetical protein VJ250_01000 [Nitrososphaeraceae archaeon]|nr:hypothetical protein [Nitrososphaeraceae archaeon]